ncbi:hypothetical protein AB0D87_49170 [Streptomyces sp. NPDC048342]|uniref:hypothetical protein n=1 Tax=Streptomyces sp. NPDC048342 TaxID=3154716 RepID=UPI003449888F
MGEAEGEVFDGESDGGKSDGLLFVQGILDAAGTVRRKSKLTVQLSLLRLCVPPGRLRERCVRCHGGRTAGGGAVWSSERGWSVWGVESFGWEVFVACGVGAVAEVDGEVVQVCKWCQVDRSFAVEQIQAFQVWQFPEKPYLNRT